MMAAEAVSGQDSDETQLRPGGFRASVSSSCPAEYAGVPIREVLAEIDAARRDRAAAISGESMAAGFLSRPPGPSAPSRAGSGFESGGVLDTSSPDAMLAGLADAVTRDGRLAELDDDELIGVLRAWQRGGSWASASLLTAVAELARRRPAVRAAPTAPGQFPD